MYLNEFLFCGLILLFDINLFLSCFTRGRYGFHTEHCQAALRICDGDVGASLEHLLTQCFSETFGERMKISEAVAHMSLDECVEQRQEEAFALKSICGEKFIERIQNRVWTIGLELEYLTSKFCKFKQK